MSKEALNWFNSLSGQNVHLKPTTRRILECLALVHSTERGCYPSQATIARRTGVSLRTVNTHLQKLEHAGLLARQQRGVPRRGPLKTTAYHFPFDPSFAIFRMSAGPVEKAVGSAVDDARSPAIHAVARMQNLRTSPLTENQNTLGAASVPGDAVEKCLSACGPGLSAQSRRLIRYTDHVVWSWLERGYDLEKDILPALRKRTARASQRLIKTWAYFNNAVADAHARRIERGGVDEQRWPSSGLHVPEPGGRLQRLGVWMRK